MSLFALSAVLITACGGGEDESFMVSDADQVKTKAAEIAAKGIAETATAVAKLQSSLPEEASATVTSIGAGETGEGSETLTPLPTLETTATLLPTPIPTATPGAVGGTPCYRANLEYETIPDGTLIPKNKVFVKLWRIKNTGTCTWTAAFTWRNVNGVLLGTQSSLPLTTVDILPNEYLWVSVTFVAPSQPGLYRSDWMLLSPDGVLFGLDPGSLGAIWIEIEVFIPDGF